MQVARVRKEKCMTADCNRCVKYCPVSTRDKPVIFIGRNKKATVDPNLCNGCGRCVYVCPEKAIEMITINEDKAPEPQQPSSAPKNNDNIPTTSTNTTVDTEPKQVPKPPQQPIQKESREDLIKRKQSEYVERVIRTLIACIFGAIAGILTYIVAGPVDPTHNMMQPTPFFGVLILFGFILLQKFMFYIVNIDPNKLRFKDWFYQAFMTFAVWYISWTLLLTISNS